MNERMTDEEIFKTAAEVHRAQVELAKVENEGRLQLEKMRDKNRRQRRAFVAYILAGLIVAALMAGGVVACQRSSDRTQERNERIATVCIQQGKEWDGSWERCETPGK